MQFNIITIFPRILDSYINESILKRAQKAKLIKINSHNPRDFTTDKHHHVDDSPYGGGPGMVMMVEPIVKALKKIKKKKKSLVIMMDPAGEQFNQKMAQKFSKLDQIIFICGRYEGIDARVDKFIDAKISVGPYVLSGGELPAAVIVEAVSRLLPGVLGKFESTQYETFGGEKQDIVEHPQYTRPEKFLNMKVPDVLLSGNHAEIDKWRRAKKK
ncbi:MAG: tRNA (guanosine(37)-N1)-methyltransferase TrmD [Patescibacteria group bacterium]